MVTPLHKTFAVLRDSRESLAQDLLLGALEHASPVLRKLAASALLNRSSISGHLAVLLRSPRLAADARDMVRRQLPRLELPFRQGLLQGTDQIRQGLIQAAMHLHADEFLPSMLKFVAHVDHPLRPEVLEAIRSIADDVAEQMRQAEISTDSSAKALAIDRRGRVLQHLARGISELETIQLPEVLVECLLIVGDPRDAVVKHVMWHSSANCRQLAAHLMLSSRHPRIMRLVTESLRHPYPHPKAFEAVQRRQDPEFVATLLQMCQEQVKETFSSNLRQIRQVDWLRDFEMVLCNVPPALQPGAVHFLAATQVSQEDRGRVQEWLLRHGTPAARMASTDLDGGIHESVVQEVVRESLEDEDTAIQAWAVGQLRQLALPGAFAILIDRLDSPHEDVRNAARSEFRGFTLARLLPVLSRLDDEACARLGRLLRKVDLDALDTLQRELEHPARQRRLAALVAAVRLGWIEAVNHVIVELAEDQDISIRRMLAELLKSTQDPVLLGVLERLASDPHPRVREAAIATLTRELGRPLPVAANTSETRNPTGRNSRHSWIMLEVLADAAATTTHAATWLSYWWVVPTAIGLIWLGIFLAERLTRGNSTARLRQPRSLFEELCQAHELGRPQQDLIRRIAQEQGLGECVPFVDTTCWQEFARKHSDQATTVRELEVRLLGAEASLEPLLERPEATATPITAV